MVDRRLLAVAAALLIATAAVAVAQDEAAARRETATQLMSLDPRVVEQIQARAGTDGVTPDNDYHYG